MRVVGIWCLVMAWSALVLPWQRCAGERHEHLVSAVVEHQCHQCPCEDGRHQHEHEEAEHTEVRFDSVVQIVIVALPPFKTCTFDAPLEPHSELGTLIGAVADEPPVPRTNVLLL